MTFKEKVQLRKKIRESYDYYVSKFDQEVLNDKYSQLSEEKLEKVKSKTKGLLNVAAKYNRDSFGYVLNSKDSHYNIRHFEFKLKSNQVKYSSGGFIPVPEEGSDKSIANGREYTFYKENGFIKFTSKRVS